MIRTLTVTTEHAGARLDSFLSAALDISRSAAARLIEEGCVTLGDKITGGQDPC